MCSDKVLHWDEGQTHYRQQQPTSGCQVARREQRQTAGKQEGDQEGAILNLLSRPQTSHMRPHTLLAGWNLYWKMYSSSPLLILHFFLASFYIHNTHLGDAQRSDGTIGLETRLQTDCEQMFPQLKFGVFWLAAWTAISLWDFDIDGNRHGWILGNSDSVSCSNLFGTMTKVILEKGQTNNCFISILQCVPRFTGHRKQPIKNDVRK